MKKLTSIIFLFVLVTTAEAQTRLILSSGRANSCEYVVFEPQRSIRASFIGTTESIEGFMASVLKADSQAKINAYTLGGVKNAEQKTTKDFEKIKLQDSQKTYFELISKLEIKSGGQYLTTVKFRLYLEQAPKGISGAYQLQKVGNRWYKTNRSDLSEIALMLVFMKKNILKELIDNEAQKDPLLIDLSQKTRDVEGLNFKKLYKEFISWEKDKTKREYFLEPTGW